MMDDVALLGTDRIGALAAARLCNFPTGKAIFLPAHIAWLDNAVARLLRSLPDPWVDLCGYASHLGNHAFNKRLSFDRCEAVRSHIKSHGLNLSFPKELGVGDADNDEAIAEYLTATLEDPGAGVFLAALGDVAKARGVARIAHDAGFGHECLYKA